MTPPLRVLSIVGARPNFMKIAPIAAAFSKRAAEVSHQIVHTGQHYDERLSKVFFEDLAIPRPDVNLEVGSGSHAQQTAAIMAAFEPVLIQSQADVLLVVGDVNSTIACALVAAKLGVKVAHVEAGLRSYDRTMPEEVNRVLTDQISDFLFTTEESALANLVREGIDPAKVHFVGNVMIDTLLAHREKARALGTPARLGLTPKAYGVITLHRPSNVDSPEAFDRLLDGIGSVAADVPLIFPVHPRTRAIAESAPRCRQLVAAGRVRLIEPLGYLEFLGLLEDSRVVLTDSGGIQEETTVLGIPCLTLRENTERPVTISHGSNLLVGTAPDAIRAGWARVRDAQPARRVPPLWDGRAAERIAEILIKSAS